MKSPAALQALADKYRALIALRLEREALEARGVFALDGAAGRARKQRGRRLARRFPGALRELDELTVAQLEQRLAEVEAELVGAGRGQGARRWVLVMLDFHALLVEALAIKRWLSRHARGARAVDAALLRRFRRYLSRSPARQHAMAGVDEAFLMRYLRPPHGRLLALVWDELAARHALPKSELSRMIFGPP